MKSSKKFINIYTGEKVSDLFEALGFKKHSNNSIKIYIEYNDNEKIIDYITNTEIHLSDDLIFVICSHDDKEFTVFFNAQLKGNEDKMFRESFADDYIHLKTSYGFNINEVLEFEYMNKKLKICIKN